MQGARRGAGQGVLALLGLLLALALPRVAAAAEEFHVPVEYYKLPNGLRVVLSQDHTAPTVCVGVYYRIGFRIEPKDRTGFAHLFEHMMFQGSKNLGKMEFIKLIQTNGGILNGSTRFDFTNYFEVVPSNKLETILWAKADRMIDLPVAANVNWYNAHNFYGDLTDIEAAKLDEVKQFFDTYYAPNNAVLVIVGDFENADAKKMVDKYFAGIKSAQVPPQPDLSEPRQEKEKIVLKKDPLAPRPAIAIGYQMPERNSPEYYAMGLLEQMLIEGDDSLLRQELVQKRGLTDSIEGGINMLGNMFNYKGPMLMAADVTYDPTTKPETVIEAIDAVIEPLRTKPVDQKSLDRARVKLRSSLYDTMGEFGGFGLMDLLASFALFDDNPARVNDLVSQFNKVTPELVQKTAQEYLRSTNRTIIELQPAPKDAAAPAKNQ